jgi:chromosome segregation protein
MRLSKIKLAGFKSFVDPTTIEFPTALTGIIGPNGCGKSNVIDAVRWVMGESSAKNLRGDSMADVIFNGSSSRKPVGTASIELIFDNSDGTVGGQYAGFSEISVRRQISRDGTSSYYLNAARCRRRDIQDIFLGTGLGPRSYSIIEQGMISRLIEARPEELRVFLEEAAGISKYKERRRETENRIRHTRENLERLGDLREEVEKQINHLDRQARTAKRYQRLKDEERLLRAQHLALRMREVDTGLEGQDRHIAETENRMQAAVSEQRTVERALEQDREQQAEANEQFNEVQGRYYRAGAEIARVEQAIQHARELRERQQADLERAEHALQETGDHIRRDETWRDDLEKGLAEMEPGLERMKAAVAESGGELERAEADMTAWQERWEGFSRETGERQQSAEVLKTRIEHLETQLSRHGERLKRLQTERAELSTGDLQGEIGRLTGDRDTAAAAAQALQQRLEALTEERDEAREEERSLGRRQHELRSELQAAGGRLSSLEALQQAALGREKGGARQWLERHGLADRARLAERIEVAAGWERAVETVLGHHLEAVCVEQFEGTAEALAELRQGELALVETAAGPAAAPPVGSLAEKVTGPAMVGRLLGPVRMAADLPGALAVRGSLGDSESVICPEGIWIGPDWIRVQRAAEDDAGVLAREQELKSLQQRVSELEGESSRVSEGLETARSRLRDVEARLEAGQHEFNTAHRQVADLTAQIDTRHARIEQAQQRGARLAEEESELERQAEEAREALRQARGELEAAVESLGEGEARRQVLEQERARLREALEAVRVRAREDREAAHELALKVESRRSSLESTRRSLERMQEQLGRLGQQQEELRQALAGNGDPIAEQESELNRLLEQRRAVEEELAGARQRMESIDTELRDKEKQRVAHEQKAGELRGELEQLKLHSQEARVRRQTLLEQLEELEVDPVTVLDEVSEEATATQWGEKLEAMEQRIRRLGAINLAAIDEFREQSERKEYLDRQHADLSEALDTLASAIRKIDRETRTRFKETFDRVNAGLQATFPRLFGGGHAYLEMTGDDLLDAGVTVMARPPGKRNSSISALSGGEKALTAVALVFSIFELNPAPFCLLDEVDAPLDDANVGRFCDLVREMSERVQFIVITHNKITMELANQLLGVTMNEPGVSRLVSVDMSEAVAMASA